MIASARRKPFDIRKLFGARRSGGLKRGKGLLVGFAMIPWAIFMVVFVIYPLLWSLVISFSNYDPWMRGVTKMKFTGLANYAKLLNIKSIMGFALLNTLEYAALSVITSLLAGLLFSMLVRASGRFKAFFRAVYFSPSIVAGLVIMMMWQFILQPRLGLLNFALHEIGAWFGARVPTIDFWRSDRLLFTIVGIDAWNGLGFSVILYLAAIDNIPKDYYDAATVDGANVWQQFRYIIFPLITPVVLFRLVTGIIGGLGVFTPYWVLQGTEFAGSGAATPRSLSLVLLVYNRSFIAPKTLIEGYFAEGQALAWVTFLITMALTMLQWKRVRQRFLY